MSSKVQQSSHPTWKAAMGWMTEYNHVALFISGFSGDGGEVGEGFPATIQG